MQIARWGFTVEGRASLIGVGVFLGLGVAGYLLFETRMVLLAVAFLAGATAALLTDSRDLIGSTGVTVGVVGMLGVLALSAARRVEIISSSVDLAPGDAFFFGLAFFVAEALLVGVVLFILTYTGALLVEKLRTKAAPVTGPRDFSRLDR